MKSRDFVNETLKRVNGRWALVSKSNPKKVLQYYHGGDQRPSEEWVNSVERRVHSFGEGVTESLDQPYPVEWDKDDFGDLHALAFLDDGSPLEIKFVQESGGQWHIVFDRNYSLRVTGGGDQQRVFATVLAAVKEFVKKRKPQKIIFSATKDVEPGQKSNSRASLYSSLVNRYAAALGYTAHIDDRGDQVVYELMRAQKPVTESSGKTDAGYTWTFEPSREVPMKPDVDANTFIRVKDPTGKTICGIWADVEGDSIQIEYSQVFDERLRGRGVYTDVLRSLSKQYTVISDKDNNNAASSIYKRLGADYDHRQATHRLRKQGVAKAKLEEIGFASALDDSTFSTDSLLKIGKVIGQVENNDVMMASAGSEVVYFLVVNNEITSFIGLNKGYLKNIKNFTKTSGVVRALLGYLIHIEGKKIKISADEPLTADGIKWITYLIKSPRGLQIIDTFGKPVDPIALKKEWELSKKSGNSGPTGIVISENQIFGNKLRDNEERRKQRSLLMPFNMYEMPNCSNQGVTEDEHDTQPRPRVVDSMKSMVDVGGIQLNVAIDGAEVSIRPVVDGYQAGYVVFDRDGRTLVPDDLAIDDEFRGRGIAKIIYDYVKSLGFTIRRSSDQTRAGKHFWDKNRGEDGMIWEAALIQQLVDIKNGPWALYESNRRVEIRKSRTFNQTVEGKITEAPHLVDKIKEFVRFKAENPSRIMGKDTPFGSYSAFGKEVPNLRHYHLTKDISLFYTISGHNPVIIKMFGVFNHHESGTSDTPNIKRQRSLAKQLGNQFDSAEQPIVEHRDDTDSPNLMSAFKDFLPIAMRELDIKKLPPIRLLKQIPAGDQPTFGKFVNDENVVYLGIAERHPVDILRTLAHELVHYKQNTEHQLAAGSGATGSPEENQAHDVAGVIMRDFNRLHPEYFKSQAVELSESADDSIIRNRDKLDAILVDLCSHVVEGQRVDPKKYGMVAACVVDPDNRQVIGVNELTPDGTRRHGERVAMERYQAQHGEIPPGSIIVTTCSPCNEEHMTERYGESCTDIINSSACRKVYCGYMDPSQDEEHNEFTLEVTSNSSIRELCEHFAATFLNENFADGRGPGRPGDSVRHGIPKNATMAELERASHAKGRKGQLARWQLNMRRGRNK